MAIEKIKIDTAKAKKKKGKRKGWVKAAVCYWTALRAKNKKTSKLLLYDLYIHKLCKVAIRQH